MRYFSVKLGTLAVCLLCTLTFTPATLAKGQVDLKGDPDLDGSKSQPTIVKHVQFPGDLQNDLGNDLDPLEELEQQVEQLVKHLDGKSMKGDPEEMHDDGPQFSPHKHYVNYPVALHPHSRHKRGFFKGIGRAFKGVVKGVAGIGKGLLGGVLNIGGMLFGRPQATAAASHYDQSMRFSLLQLCNEICVTEWSMWSPCSKPCGGGIQERKRENQLPGQCSKLKDFKCHKSTSQQRVCNERCENGASPSDTGCSCQPGWSGTCCTTQNMCPYPGKPRNGKLLPTRFPAVYGSVAMFECLPGFSISGEEAMHCQADGTWRGAKPTCEPIRCRAEEPNPNVRILNRAESYMFGEDVIYRCGDGYVLDGPTARKCRSPDGSARGRLTGFNPECRAVTCEDPGTPVNGLRTLSELKFGGTANYTCNSGYKLVGPPTMRCLASGNWLGRVPTCEEIKCDPPFPPRNGGIQLRNARFGASVVFECDDGYELLGNQSLRCLSDGYWNGIEPKCKAINCGNPGIPVQGAKDGSQYTFPHTVSFRCFNGYTLEGAEEIECQQDATWSNTKPTCKACPMNTYMDGLRNPGQCLPCGPNMHTTTEGSTQRQNCLCDDGFDGPPGGPCIKIECPPLSVPVNGRKSDCSRDLESTCSFTCNHGYILDKGDSMRTCQSNGQWDGDDASCSACPENTYKSDERSCLPCPENSFTNDTVANSLEGCVCRPGYSGNPEGQCDDDNECAGGRGPCEQTCENRPGGYICGCSIPGYVIDDDQHSCRAEKQCKNLTRDEAPMNGGLVCHWYREENSQQCGVKCDRGYEFPSRVNDYEYCGPATGYGWSFRRDDPEAEIPPCIEQFYPDLILQAETSYFVRACEDLLPEEQKEVKEQFISVLNDQKICEKRETKVCLIDHVEIICGRRTLRKKRSVGGVDVEEELSSVDFNFNITAFKKEGEKTLDCPMICKKFRIPDRHCKEKLCWDVYRGFLKASVMYAERHLKNLYRDREALQKLRFQAAERDFHPEEDGASSSGLKSQCPRGMQWTEDDEICVPCFAGSYYDERTESCEFCPPGMYQMLRNQTHCEACPNGTTSIVTSNHTGPTFCLQCAEGYWGQYCEKKCACVNGRCDPTDGTCVCHSGWEGDRCDMDVQGCVSGSCFRDVTCSDVPAPGTGFTCGACPDGFHGDGSNCARIGRALNIVI